MAYKNIIKNRYGFSLAELMVASGLLSLLAVATMKISDINLKSLKRSEASLETHSITTAMAQNLLNGQSCVNTLSPLGELTNGKAVSSIRNRVNEAIFNTSDSYGPRTLKISSMKIEDLSITPNPIPSGQKGYGEMNLVVELERLSSQISSSSKMIEKKIPLKVEVDSSKQVVRCYAATENAVDTAKMAACNNIGGVYNSVTESCDLSEYPQAPSRNIAVSTKYLQDHQVELDDKYVDVAGDTMTGALNVQARVTADEFCVGTKCRNFDAKACAPGQMVERVEANGNLVCKGIACAANKYFEGFNASGNPICKALPTGTCPTNSYVKEINSDGTVVCANVPYHWGVACSAGQYIESISGGGIPTCKSLSNSTLGGKICPTGRLLRGFDANGNVICDQSAAGWPAGSYCIGRNGSCPAGFYQRDGYLRGIRLYDTTSPYIVPAQFGSSSIQCHGGSPPCTYRGYSELFLSMCCK